MKKYREWAFMELGKLFPSHAEMNDYPDNITVAKCELLNKVYDILSQLDEPEVLSQELPVIPRFVAEWIEALKSKEINMLESIYDFIHEEDINDYMREKGNVLMRAWLGGYEVAEEQKYVIKISEHDYMVMDDEGFMYPTDINVHKYKSEFTEQEIKDYDERFWTFAVKVEELEE